MIGIGISASQSALRPIPINHARWKMNEIKAIFFDAGGTLFEVRGSVGEIYADIASSFGVRLDLKP